MTYIKLDGDKIPELNRELQLVDEIMRFLVINIDPRIADTMVAVARGEAIPEAEETEEETSESNAVETAAAE